MKRVQLAGSTFDVEGFLVGLEREVRVDISNDSLRLHDGVKVGGFEILNRDANNVLYQARSPELDGFNFGAQEKGIVCRVGPATYRIRRIEVNPAQLVITHPRGTEGNMLIEFSEVIESDHTITGLWTFTQPIAAEGGVVGNLVGDVTGNVTGNLTGNANGDHTGSFTGHLDTRTFTIQMDDDQLPENAVHQLLINRGVPYGAILMWSGIVADIPESWALCDGTNGTPDLQNRFIVGAGDTYAELATGGAATLTGSATIDPGGAHSHTLTIEPHALTEAEMPAHSHINGVCDENVNHFNHGNVPAVPATARGIAGTSSTGNIEGITGDSGAGAEHTHAGSVANEGGAHTHDITLDEIPSLPPYFALCFIMKIAAD